MDVPAVLNPLQFIHEPRNMEGNRTSQVVQDSSRRQADVEFIQKLLPESYLD